MKQAPHRPWTPDELAELRRTYTRAVAGVDLALDRLAKSLGRNKANVCRKARALGLTDGARPKVVQRQLFMQGPRFAPEVGAARIAESLRTRWTTRPHPRGMAGKRHSTETLKRLSEASRARWATWTDDQISAMTAKAVHTRLERFGTGNAAAHSENAYSRARRGRRADLAGRFFRSAWEANLARSFEYARQHGRIAAWEYEPQTFRFPRKAAPFSYTPDFRVVPIDGDPYFVELKGWWTRPDLFKFALFLRYYRHQHRLEYIDADGYRDIERTDGPLIPTWEWERRP